MEIVWAQVYDFPNYLVSNYGDVSNATTGKLLRHSMTQQGAVKVNLMRDNVSYTRSVKVLVAELFLDGASDIFNTPIHLDGDQENNRADNLAWRPRWFAWKYSQQFHDDAVFQWKGKIKDLETGETYASFFAAACKHGLLVKDIVQGIMLRQRVFPTSHLFGYDD